MLQEANIPIDFGQGLDTKTDPKLVVAGKMLLLENGTFTNPKRIAKRNGYAQMAAALAAGGNLTSPLLSHGYKNELLVTDQGSLLALSPTQSKWFNRGPCVSTDITRQSIDQAHPASGFVDSAVLGNYALYGWSTATDAANPYSVPYASVVDLASGTVIQAATDLHTGSPSVSFPNPVRCVLLGGTQLAVVYLAGDQGSILLRTVTIGSGTVTFGAEQTISTGFHPATGFNVGGTYDIAATAAGAVALYRSGTGIAVVKIDNTGAIVTTVTRTSTNADGGPLHISLNGTNIWVYWTESTFSGFAATACAIKYAVYDSALSVVLNKTNVVTMATPLFNLSNFTAVTADATHQTLYYGSYAQGISGGTYGDVTNQALLSSGGTVGGSTVFAGGIVPYSRPFTQGGHNYAIFLYRGANLNPGLLGGAGCFTQAQPTYYVVQIGATATVVGRFGSGTANLQSLLTTNISFCASVTPFGAAGFIFPCGVVLQSFGLPGVYTEVLAGVFAYLVDFASARANRALTVGGVAIFNGGLVQLYDGQAVSEFGFHQPPEIALCSAVGSGGAMTAGKHSVIAIYQWTDAQGNLHQSTPSTPVTVTTVANDSVNISVTNPFLSQKTGVQIAIFMTNAAGTQYFEVTNQVFGLQTGAGFVSTFLVTMSDATMALNVSPYTAPGSPVLENTTPPPSMIMATHNNRLQFVDSENPNTWWYTKSVQPAVGLSPSGFLTQTIDSKFGDIAALAEMDDKLAILKDLGVAVQSGDGADDTGGGSSLSFPQFIPSDVGCNNLKSVIGTPNGVMFKSPNGIYLLSRSLGVTYIGAEVEKFNSETITDARLVPGKSQIRFLKSSGTTLVYDYIFNQWSTFTAHLGVSATVFGGAYVYVTTAGKVFQESSTLFADNGIGYALRAQTSWLALATVQGFQRVRRLLMLGDFVNGANAAHAVQISAAYDFVQSFGTPVPFVFGAANASGVLQYRERLGQQKCDAISLLIEEVVTNDSAEYLDLSNLSFEAAVKKGLNKVGTTASVG